MLDIIERENLELVRYAVELHQNGHIQPGTYIVDLEALAENAVKVRDRASDLGLGVYVMTKQWNRNPAIGRTLAGEGLNSFVAVDVQCTIEIRRQELQLGHVGHLVQIPRHQIEQVLRMAPEVWTVYGYDNAVLVSRACERLGVQQDLLLKVVGPDDFVYPGQEGGVPLDRVVEVARRIGDLQGVRIVGTTGFPCVLYDPEKGSPQALPNLTSVTEAARMLEHEAGVEIRQVNCPGTSSCASMEIVKRQGGTQVEPGNSLWGMAPQQLFGGDPGTAAVVFVTEVSHIEEGGGFARRRRHRGDGRQRGVRRWNAGFNTHEQGPGRARRVRPNLSFMAVSKLGPERHARRQRGVLLQAAGLHVRSCRRCDRHGPQDGQAGIGVCPRPS